MLFFLLIYLFICNETNTAKFNESQLLDKLYKNMLQVNTVLQEVQQQKPNTSESKVENKHGLRNGKQSAHDRIRNLQMTNTQKKNWKSKSQNHFSPKLHFSPQPAISDRRQGFSRRFPTSLASIRPPFLVIRRPPPGYRMAIVPIKPGVPGPRLKRPRFLVQPKHPGLDPSQFFSDYLPQNAYLRPSGPFRPRPKQLNESALHAELDYYHKELPNIFNPFHFVLTPHPPDYAESGISQAFTTPYSYTRPTNENGEHIWLTEVYSSYVPEHSSEMTVVTTTPHSSSISTEYTFNLPDLHIETATSNPGDLFLEDEHGFLYLTVPQKGVTTVPAPLYSETLESTTAGDVFYGKITVNPPPRQSPLQRYLELVERLQEGYMLVFVLELCRLLAVKPQSTVRQALYHTETVYNHWWNNGRLVWIEEPLQTVIWKLVKLVSEGDIEVVQTYASMMFHMLLRRRQTLSAEVNSILDKADLFYSDEDGEELFKALMEFENYPNTTKSSYALCDRLVESFLSPFRRRGPYRILRRQKLMESINSALKARFPRLQTSEVNSKGVFGKKKRKKRRRPYPYRMMRKRKKYGRIRHDQNSILRTMSPMIGEQLPIAKKKVPIARERVPVTGEQAPVTGEQAPLTRDQRPVAREQALIAREQASMKRDQASVTSEPAAMGRELVPVTGEKAPLTKEQMPVTVEQAPMTRDKVTFRAIPSKSYKLKNRPPPITISFLNRPARAYSFNKKNRKLTHKNITSFQEKLDAYFGRNIDRSSKRTGHHHTTTAEHRLPPRVTTVSTGPVLLRSSYFGRNDDRGSKNTDHHRFVRKSSVTGHRPPPRVTASSTSSELLRSSSYDTSSGNIGHHHFIQKTSTARHRTPLRTSASSTSSELLRSNSRIHLKRSRKSKKHYHHQKGTLKNSKRQKYEREKLRARLIRKKFLFPTKGGSSASLSGSS